MISSNVGISNFPLNSCGPSARSCTLRSCLISASVKSEAKKPVSAAPSMLTVRRREANSGRLATSVGVMRFGSWPPGGGNEVRLVARDEVAVLGGDEIRLDVIRAELDCKRVALEGMRRQVAVRAAMADDQRPGLVRVSIVILARLHRRRHRASHRDRRDQSLRHASECHVPLPLCWNKKRHEAPLRAPAVSRQKRFDGAG